MPLRKLVFGKFEHQMGDFMLITFSTRGGTLADTPKRRPRKKWLVLGVGANK
jgi:hypothetical protein